MMGTLAAVLAKRKIATHSDLFRAQVDGEIRDVKGVLRITDIAVTYFLEVPAGKKEDALWAFDNYLEKCPAAQSVIGCIRIAQELKVEEAP